MSESIVVRENGLQLVASPAEAQRRLLELQQFVKGNMVQGEDYGTIPGTQKPTLYQPGAQKLGEIYGLGWRYEDTSVTEDWDHGLFVYRKKCVLFARSTGEVIGEGCGSCNSREDRYAWRWVGDRDVPAGVDKSSLVKRTKQTQRGAWVQYRLPNPDLASLVNTIEKMACKRAFVAAIIAATRSAGIFTQDLEDLPHLVETEDEPAPAPAKSTKSTPKVDESAAFVAACLESMGAAESGSDLDAIGNEIVSRKKTLNESQLGILRRAMRSANARIAPREPGDDADEIDAEVQASAQD